MGKKGKSLIFKLYGGGGRTRSLDDSPHLAGPGCIRQINCPVPQIAHLVYPLSHTEQSWTRNGIAYLLLKIQNVDLLD